MNIIHRQQPAVCSHGGGGHRHPGRASLVCASSSPLLCQERHACWSSRSSTPLGTATGREVGDRGPCPMSPLGHNIVAKEYRCQGISSPSLFSTWLLSVIVVPLCACLSVLGLFSSLSLFSFPKITCGSLFCPVRQKEKEGRKRTGTTTHPPGRKGNSTLSRSTIDKIEKHTTAHIRGKKIRDWPSHRNRTGSPQKRKTLLGAMFNLGTHPFALSPFCPSFNYQFTRYSSSFSSSLTPHFHVSTIFCSVRQNVHGQSMSHWYVEPSSQKTTNQKEREQKVVHWW